MRSYAIVAYRAQPDLEWWRPYTNKTTIGNYMRWWTLIWLGVELSFRVQDEPPDDW